MSTSTIGLDTKRYGRLLAKALPAVIKSEDENNRMLAIIEGLLAKGEENLTAEEDALLELLVDLVHDFEEQHYPLPSSPPHQMVAFLLEQRARPRTRRDRAPWVLLSFPRHANRPARLAMRAVNSRQCFSAYGCVDVTTPAFRTHPKTWEQFGNNNRRIPP